MAYVPYYTINFTNEQNQEVLVTISQKDGAPTTPVNYQATKLEINDNGEDQTKYNCLIVRELVLGIWSEIGQSLTWETFVTSAHDEWKVDVTIDGMKYFEGFITPDEGTAAFQDQPYEVEIRATNSLALLKGVPLTDIDGNNFDGDHSLIEYLAGALQKTLLDLPIRIYCNYLHAAMLNKGNGLEYDMFRQTFLNYRTFLKDPTTFVSCYDALKIILDKFCTLEYWNGYWQIVNIAEKQFLPGDWFYVDYDENGANPAGTQVTENYAQIGKNVDIYPINEDQQISSRFAVKSVKTSYTYEVWPELPKNNKFERGTQTGSGTNPDGSAYKIFTIDDWEQGEVDLFDLPNPAMTPISEKFYRKSSYNDFNIEVDREIIGETRASDDSNHSFWLRSEGVPVYKGDKLKFTLQKKFDNNFGSGGGSVITIPATIYVVSGSDAYYLDNNVDGHQTGTARWKLAVNLAGQLLIEYPAGSDTREYASLSIETEALPVDGVLYVAIAVDGPIVNTGPLQYHKDISLDYLPFIAGGYIPVKGDYYFREQVPFFPDVTEDEVKISDSLKKVLKGALLFVNESVNELTTPGWYRIHSVATPNPNNEAYGFKELLNIGRINNAYRRMLSLEGSFNGLIYSPENNQLAIQPLGFHKRYRLVDLAQPRDFVLVPPLKMDVITGWITANLVEVIKDENDGTQFNENTELKYIF